MQRHHFTGRVGDKRRLPRQHLVQDDAQRVDVGLVLNLAGPFPLLGSHVQRRPHRHADLRLYQRRAQTLLLGDLGDAKVQDLGLLARRIVQVADNDDVVGLQIAVDDALAMRGGQGLGNLPSQLQRVVYFQATPKLGDTLRQRVSIEIVHHDVGAAVGQSIKLKDVYDARVLHDVRSSGLVEEAHGHLWIFREIRMQHFDRCSAANVLVYDLEDDAHAAFSEFAHYAIVTDSLVDHATTLWLVPRGRAAAS